jgi:hypothetical protein
MSLGPVLRSSLRCRIGSSHSSWEESLCIYSCGRQFTSFFFLTCCESAIVNIWVKPSWTSWYPLLGCISRILLFGSDSAMFSFLKNLQAIFQNDVFRFILTSSVPELLSCSILVLSNTCYPPMSYCGWKIWFSRRTIVEPEGFLLANQALYPLRNATCPGCCHYFWCVFSQNLW